MQISIPIPLTKYTLNMDGTYTDGAGAVYDGLDCYLSEISEKSARFNTKVVKAWISGTPSTSSEKFEINVYLKTAKDTHPTPVFSGSIISFVSSNPDPSLYGNIYFESIANRNNSIEIGWDNTETGYIKLPFISLEIMVKYTSSRGSVMTSKFIPLPTVNVNPANITKDAAKITADDCAYITNINLYKQGIKTDLRGTITGNTITFTGLEVDCEYLLELDYCDGRVNLMRFTPREACMWAKIDGTYKKGMVWFKTSGGWKRAKGVFCRKSKTDSWKKGV